ncbi:hypothetical protein F5Y10DRAFT_284914 [Nemania abortiva]|nr:hypothetical protein F5Y10DRAFT_284914 [Nemania abortiva]
MEAFAALSTAVNIAQALDYGLQLIRKSKNLRNFGVIDLDTNDDIWRLRNLVTNLSSQEPLNADGDVQILAAKCAEMASALVSQLGELTPIDPKSKRQRAKAIWKSERSRRKIRKVGRQLKSYERQLHLYLTSLSRIELNKKLADIRQDISRIGGELSGMSLAVKGLTNSAHLGQAVVTTLQPLVQLYYDRRDQSSEELILDKLHFPNMHERFDTIIDAHTETLSWVFDPANSNHNAKKAAGEDFIAWLREGSGFFHISGKPGAGKSTMMKHICSQEDLDNHLKVWCQSAQLGRGEFFFWWSGTTEQKSLKGLLRGILHSILHKNRELIPTAFPDLWKLTLTHSSSSRELEYRDFQQGLDNIFKYAGQSLSYKFALFIDGLDEFEGRHLELIDTMKLWVERYPSTLKICVSSREYAVFQQSFSSYPKLRLHELTFTDISRMALARLKSIPQCAELFTSDEELQMVVDLISTRAEGVFLWVSIVLIGIEDAIISGASLQELEEKTEAYPTELEPLYWHLVQLIHETDRIWAFRALKTVQFFQSQRSNVHNHLAWGVSVLELSFLEEMQYHGISRRIPEAPVFQSEAIEQRLTTTYKKIYGRCKGFLHVQVYSGYAVGPPGTMGQQVVFIHRSVMEFLETSNFTKMVTPYMSGFDCFGNACVALPRCIEYQRPIPDVFCKNSSAHDITLFWKFTVANYLSLATQSRVAPKALEQFLENLQGAFSSILSKIEQRRTHRYFDLGELTADFLQPSKEPTDGQTPNSIDQCCSRRLDSHYKTFYRYGRHGCWSHITQKCFTAVIDSFFAYGPGFNGSIFFKTDRLERAFLLEDTLWGLLIRGYMINVFSRSWCPGAIDWCLRHGANPDLVVGKLISGGPRSFRWLSPEDGWHLFSNIPPGSFSFENSTSFDGVGGDLIVMHETTQLCQLMISKGGVLRLRDLLSDWFPDSDYFPNLIDRLPSNEQGNHTDPILPSEAEMPPWQSMKRTWETDYLVYSRAKLETVIDTMGLTIRDLDKECGFESH